MQPQGKGFMALPLLLILTLLLVAAFWLSGRNRNSAWANTAPSPPPGRTAALQRHVDYLAGHIGERHLWRPRQLEQAASYIEEQFRTAGCTVHDQTYQVQNQSVRNLIAEIPGRLRPEEIVVIGAHYDSVIGTPGANDNASGVAALLELARLFCGSAPDRTLRLVAFVNEEPPFFQTEEMGSLVYAQAARDKGDRIVAMVSLETIGYYSQVEGSQSFPFAPLRLIYPTRGNFLAFVGNWPSRKLLQQALAAFRRSTPFPAQGLVAPEWVVGVNWSDQWSFWRQGYPAIMVTDTAPFRYPHYHAATDTPDRLDYDALARVTEGLAGMVTALCSD